MDRAAGLPPGTTSNYARTRGALLRLTLARIAELDAAEGAGETAGPAGPGNRDRADRDRADRGRADRDPRNRSRADRGLADWGRADRECQCPCWRSRWRGSWTGC